MKNPDEYQVVILAAGCSRRLSHLTQEVPKSLLKIQDTSIIDYHLETLTEYGFNDFLFVGGYLKDVLIEHVGSKFPNLKASFVISDDFETTSHGWSLFLTQSSWKKHKKPVLLLHADTYLHPQIYDRLIKSEYNDHIPADKKFSIETRDEVLVMGEDGIVNRLERGREDGYGAVGELIGIHKFSAEFMGLFYQFIEKYMSENGRGDHYETILDSFLINDIHRVNYLTMDLPWININYEDDLLKANQIRAYL